MSDEFNLTIEDVAQRFGVNPSTIYRLVQQGTLPGFKLGNQWRFSETMLKEWVADQVAVEQMKKEDAEDSGT